jgi:hypothetical protein
MNPPISTRTWLFLIVTSMFFYACEKKEPKVESPEQSIVETSDEVEFLLVQNAGGVSLADGVLRLKNIAPTTLYFSDRPDRIVGRVTTKEYVDHWAVGDNNFSADPPNAVLSVLQGDKTEDIAVVLTEPRLEDNDLVYTVEILEGNPTIEAGAAALFIDIIGAPLTPLSVAGVARRTTRRTVRRRMY